jgi:CHAD domain-containing protein
MRNRRSTAQIGDVWSQGRIAHLRTLNSHSHPHSMSFRFEIDESSLKGIQRIAGERTDRVLRAVSKKRYPNPELIHQARKDLKSLRALLRLARASMPDESYRRENTFFRDVGRSLSAARDRQVILEAIERLQGNPKKNAPASRETRVHKIIEQLRRRLQREAGAKIPAQTLAGLPKELGEGHKRINHWFDGVLLNPAFEWDLFIGTGLRRIYKRGRKLLIQFDAVGPENLSDETWHELRKFARILGFQLRLLQPSWPRSLAPLLKECDQLAKKLGIDHDFAVLRARVLKEPAESQATADAQKALIQAIDRRKRKLRGAALQIARHLYSEKPRQFDQRLASYWHLWRKGGAEEVPASGRAGVSAS